jgi:hypothetical protein
VRPVKLPDPSEPARTAPENHPIGGMHPRNTARAGPTSDNTPGYVRPRLWTYEQLLGSPDAVHAANEPKF